MAGEGPRESGAAELDGGPRGLLLENTEIMKSFLVSAQSAAADNCAINCRLPLELCDVARELAQSAEVPYGTFRRVWAAMAPESRPPLRRILTGSGFILVSPKPREKSIELKERLGKLQEMTERKAYDELVKDVAPKKVDVEPFSSYKDQIGFGLHVVLIMFTGYLVGYAAFRALFDNNVAMNAAGGILGLVGGMLVETMLFIVKTSNPRKTSKTSKSRLQIKKHL